MLRRIFLLGSLVAACQQPPAPPAEGPPASPEPAAEVSADRGTTPDTRDQVDADGVVRRGAPLTSDPVLSLADTAARASELDGRVVTVSGQVDAACGKKGCWMVIQDEDGEHPIRVTAEGYGFFVPRRAPGLTAVVQGTLEVKTIDIDTAQHYEDERVMGSDEKPRTITEPQQELSIVARGLELRPAG
jgi:hypothetical protein